jgi:glycosyltransferase involved in cell wall biosynthesis
MKDLSGSGVSVIITTFNGENTIKKTVESVLSQTFDNLQIIVIDDASTDKTFEILEEAAVLDARIELHRLQKNSNLPAVARNIGISKVKFKYIAFLDHDDLWEKFKIERQVKLLNSNKDIMAIHCRLQVFSKTKNKLRHFWYPRIPKETTQEQLIKENNVKYSSVMIRKDILESIGKFDENPELRAVEDLDFWIRIASVYKIQFQNDLMGYYFFSEKGTSQEETNHIKLERLYKKINLENRVLDKERIRANEIVSFFINLIYLNFKKYLFRAIYNRSR